MSGNTPGGGADVTCEVFDSHADELALGLLGEPQRTGLLAHAARCPACRALLDDLAAVGDRLLLAAPELEPPAGFESRVLDRLPAPTGAGDTGASATSGHRRAPAWARGGRRHRPGWRATAAAGVALVVGAVAATVIVTGRETGDVDAEGAIVTASGQEVGEIRLLTKPVPHLLITVPNPQGAPGVRFCELQRPDGSWVRVGSWEAVDIASGVWAAGIDPSLLDASAMRVVTDQGVLLATATLR